VNAAESSLVSLESLYWCGSIFLWSFFTGLGVPPLPEEAGVLYAASLAALHPQVHWFEAWPAASLGIMAADLVLYGIGRLWGHKVLASRWVARILDEEKRQQIERRFHQHGMKFLLVARLLPPLRTGVFIVAGTIRFSLLEFLIADAIYGVVGVGLVFFGGTAIVALIHQVGYWLLAVLGAIVAGAVFYYFYRRRHGATPRLPKS
jgi:membrane protein DedA with SNARE-associated domain